MANNIKIVGNILNTTEVSRYSTEDVNLMSSKRISENFGEKNDYIEYHIYDIGGNFLSSNYNYLDYKLPSNIGLTPGVSTQPNTTGDIQTENVGIVSTLATPTSSLYPIIEIDPIQDLQNLGYSSGEFSVRYNLFQNRLSNYIDSALFIKEISQDRTEIRLASITLTNDEIESVATSMIDEINNTEYYVDYLLNFGNNEQYVAVNVALNKISTGYEILFKLYEPLPLDIQEKQTLWVVEEKVNPYIFNINLDKLVIPPPPPTLRGPNFDIEIPNQGTISTTYNTYSNLVTGLQSLQQNSYHQILNLLTSQSVNINIDYTSFDNFIFFGSAYQRLYNFYNKIKEIEDYNTLISTYTPLSSSIPNLITEINKYSSSISDVISKFDGYESYLYFESGTYAWPKTNSTKPFILESTGSSNSIAWYGLRTTSASLYDLDNYNNLEYAVPEFIKNDTNNQPFLLFLNMVGHYFDNVWIYLKAITDINVANNNLNEGISKDLVYERLKSLGLHLYNSQAGEDVSQFLVGANTGSSVWDNNTTITGSYLNNIPRKDIVAELYKRIYHNLPLLLKQKGTVAGLQNLITTFGISSYSRPYTCGIYKFEITQSSIPEDVIINYVPCGQQDETQYQLGDTFILPNQSGSVYVEVNDSSIAPYIPIAPLTATTVITKIDSYQGILGIKEYGGGLKSSLINGYNNDKVRIVNNTINGNILSPLLSLQTFPTASNEFRENDDHYIDISFSPQNQIDSYVSGAISSSNPSWSLDDYIGDPRQQYYSTYPDLDNQRKLYFETGVSGYAPFTASALDYNGFIRLIQYFDNSLFKMLNDFVPERTSLSTGITFNSPVLERNKVAYANLTTSTTQSIVTAEYQSSSISPQYGKLYDQLQGDKKPFFTGELSSSTVDVHQYFVDNYNPYLGDWNVWNLQHNVTQSINLNSFLHSDWNVLLNNVSRSVISNTRQNVEYIGGDFRPTASITFPAELQDTYLSLRSYNISRYEGSKTISLLYNTYTPASDSYGGDQSFGKTTAIDHTVRKIGLFTQIESSSILPNRNNVRLKYIVDEFGELTELNQINKNWWDIQRTFLMADTASVSLFDNKKYSNQKATDGNKLIFDSGYRYSPVLYGSGNDKKLFFQGAIPSSYYAKSNNVSSSYSLVGSSSLGYPISSSIVTKIFNNIVQGAEYMSPGGPGGGVYNSWPSYSIQESGNHYVSINFDMSVNMPNYGSSSFTLQVSHSLIGIGSQTQVYSFQPSTVTAREGLYFSGSGPSSTLQGTAVSSVKSITIGGTTYGIGTLFWRFPNYFYTSFDPIGCTYNPADALNDYVYTPVSPEFLPYTEVSTCPGNYQTDRSVRLYSIPNFDIPVGTTTKNFNVTLPAQSLTQGNVVTVKFRQDYTSSSNITASFANIGSNYFEIYSLSTLEGNYPFASSSLEYFSDLMITLDPITANPAIASELILSPTLTNFYSPNYTFLPLAQSGSTIYSSSLYNTYGDVDDPFQLNTFSIFTAYDKSGSYFESRIIDITNDNSNGVIRFKLSDSMPYTLREQLSSLSLSANADVRFLFLKRIEDETSAYLTFKKRPGQTSYGFLIPENLAKDVLDNINIITSQVKQKLVNDQGSIITDINGGGF